MSYDNLRNLLNDNYDLIRPILAEALTSAINAAEENDEEVANQLVALIQGFVDNWRNDAEVIDTYLSTINANSATRQFFVRFVGPIAPPPPPPLAVQFAQVDEFLRMFPSNAPARNRENQN